MSGSAAMLSSNACAEQTGCPRSSKLLALKHYENMPMSTKSNPAPGPPQIMRAHILRCHVGRLLLPK